MTKFTIVSTPEFKSMLSETINYYSEFSYSFSYDVLREFEEGCKVISYFPYIVPKFKENENVRKFIIKNRFIVIYKIEGNEVRMLYFIDGHMQNNNLEVNEVVELIYQI